jgi:hypothetical protein
MREEGEEMPVVYLQYVRLYVSGQANDATVTIFSSAPFYPLALLDPTREWM